MKLSNVQIFWMLTTMALGVALLLTLRPTLSMAKQDAWISILIGGAISAFAVYIAVKLCLLYPNQTLIEFSQSIFGKTIGRLVLLLYFFQWYSVTGIILREFSELMKLTMPRTPTWFIILGMLLIVVYATYQGIEVIGRCSEFIGPISILIIFITFIMNMNNVHIRNVLPIYSETGFLDIIRGSVPTAGFIGQNVIVMMLIAFMTKPKDGLRAGIWGTAVASLIVSLAALIVVATFGSVVPHHMWYPYFRLIRVITIADFIQNVDIVFVVIWLTSVFMRLTLIFFAISYGSGKLLHLKNWRKGIWIHATIVFIISLLPSSVIESDVEYPVRVTQHFTLPVLIIGFPLLMLIIGTIRKKKGNTA